MPFRFFKKRVPEKERMRNDNEKVTYEKEKEFFLNYRGISFYMAREGGEEYDDYKSKKVPKELEYEWMEEYRDDLRKKLEVESNINQLSMLFFDYSYTAGEFCRSSEPLLYMLDFATGISPD